LACLEGKDLVNELADRTGLLEAKALCCLLETANHGRRTAQKNLDIIGRLGKIFLEHGQSLKIAKLSTRELTSIMSAVT
jgi:hypothetical protein